jgi:hypothetical protein
MKKIITLASLVLLTFQSFSQTSTKIQLSDSTTYRGVTKEQLMKDSLVAIPKTIAIWMAQDVEKARSYEQEIVLLTESLDYKEKVIRKQDTIVDMYREKVSSYIKLNNSCQELNQNYEIEIMGLKKDVKKQTNQKKFWRIVAIVVPPLVGAVVHYDWKYGKP